MPGDLDAERAALRLWFGLWGNQRHCATVVLEAERRADIDVGNLVAEGLPEARVDAVRESLVRGHVEDQDIHYSVIRHFLRFREAARVWLEAETRAFAGFGRHVERLGHRTALAEAERAMHEFARDMRIPDPLLADLLRGRENRGLAQGVRVLRARESVTEEKIEAARAAGHAFDEAVGDDELARDFRDLARAQARYAERRPSIRAGDVEVFVRKHPDLPGRQIVARHGDGLEVVLVENHDPNIVFPRVYPNGFSLEPRHGRHLVYSSQASGDESGAMLTVVDTRTGEVTATITRADYPGVAWLHPGAFVWVGGPGARHGVRRFDPTAGTSELLHLEGDLGEHSVLRSVVGSGNALRGAERAWAVVSSNRGPHGSENRLEAFDPYDSSRRTVLLTYADATLGNALVTPDNRLIVVSWSAKYPRGRIAEVPLDLDRERVPPEEWLDIVPDDGESVVREVVAVDRGPGRDPLLAISRTRHGAAEVQLLDPTTGCGTSVPMEHLGLPPVYGPDGNPEAGVFGQITAMTAGTERDGTPVVEFEHSSIVSSPAPFTFHSRRTARDLRRRFHERAPSRMWSLPVPGFPGTVFSPPTRRPRCAGSWSNTPMPGAPVR
ncbi:hypothetical protein [Embleya sp. NPDC020630]|uniref:hypothetical protein n=1 Tax=Embleya sp. NPDC020630 TaxID=3363979 RepID=UPI00378B7AB6